jgi:hypothetical protein
MQISRTSNADISSLSQGLRPDGSAGPRAGGISAWSVDTDTAGYVRKALSHSCDSASSTDQAKALLAAGQLDSPAAIREAATNLATLGI